jgi:preprotein translocase subunit SecE
VADKNRGGRSVGDDDSFDENEEFDDAEFDAELDDDGDTDDESFDEDEDAPASTRRRATAGVGARARAGTAAKVKSKDARPGPFGRIVNFIREIYAELQKVIWPTRKELLTYTSVVIVFVAIMMTFVSLLDVGFARLMFLVFGHGGAS